MQIKFTFNNFACVCHSLAACQRHTPSSLAAVIGLSNNDVISLRSLRALRLDGNSALVNGIRVAKTGVNFWTLFTSMPLPSFSSPPVPLETGSLNPSYGVWGGPYVPPVRSGAKTQPTNDLVHTGVKECSSGLAAVFIDYPENECAIHVWDTIPHRVILPGALATIALRKSAPMYWTVIMFVYDFASVILKPAG